MKSLLDEVAGEAEGKGAVADALLDGGGEFGEGLVVAVGDEDGVVAEAVCAVRGAGDAAGADAVEDFGRAAEGIMEGDGADEACAAVV